MSRFEQRARRATWGYQVMGRADEGLGARALVAAATGIVSALVVGCEMHAHAADESAKLSPAHRAPETRKKAPVNPRIIAASQAILLEHADAPLGSEFPVQVDGKNYIARIEQHDNASSAPGRPPGKHRGVTVYEP